MKTERIKWDKANNLFILKMIFYCYPLFQTSVLTLLLPRESLFYDCHFNGWALWDGKYFPLHLSLRLISILVLISLLLQISFFLLIFTPFDEYLEQRQSFPLCTLSCYPKFLFQVKAEFLFTWLDIQLYFNLCIKRKYKVKILLSIWIWKQEVCDSYYCVVVIINSFIDKLPSIELELEL